ncbi:NADH dehydrogenase [ubiquinone] 1 beta subcomplex subunit 11, mitochondrial-like [Saccostrea cucullata]|uniref:NADH dehydrogenase [ubiquinone] 1 beta subcomplex subunit 11, mitochondrial-like n=1 Tax=Saccostrea cuccullata TaxID=36930 RepID=UPI002ED55350
MATFLGRTCRLHQQLNGAKRFIQRHSVRCVSTSDKKESISFTPADIADETKRKELHKRLEEHFKDDNLDSPKNRIYYGFEENNAEVDKFHYHSSWLFWFVCPLALGIAVFNFALNDAGLQSWYVREARLLIEERESKGLPHIDKNFIDPSKIVLPSEEEIEALDIDIVV